MEAEIFIEKAKDFPNAYERSQCNNTWFEKFLLKAQEKFGSKYTYIQESYIRSDKPITIICPVHKEFQQLPKSFLLGKGCPECYREQQLQQSKDNFIEKAQVVHNGKYDYSNINYSGQCNLIYIPCKEHGIFKQYPYVHLRGVGCPECSYIKNTKDKFIEKAQQTYKGLYDYSKVDYKGHNNLVTIICKEHGEFQVTPKRHIQGVGCKKCKGNPRLKTTEQFIQEAISVHGSLYDYHKAIYKGAFIHLEIVCKVHGIFQQQPHDHLKGCGCPKCTKSIGENVIEQYLREKDIKYISQYKVSDLKNVRHLSYDFYIPSCTLLIEYNGGQHYHFVPHWHKTEQGFHLQKHRDWLKRKYAKTQGIRLLTIPYWEFDNIPKILKEAIDDN